MTTKWTRELVIRHILDCDANDIPLTVGNPGVTQSLYQAGSRVFGSWGNAIQAAGLPLKRGNCGEKWPPSKILTVIRNLSRRNHPLNVKQLEERYGSMLSAARRLFGSWSKAVLAAGVDPTKIKRVTPWTRDLVIEGILTRALRNESLTARAIQPRSLVAAGRRFFGSWSGVLEAAGLDPKATALRAVASPIRDPSTPPGIETKGMHRLAPSWTREAVIIAIQTRLQQQKPMNAIALNRDDTALYLAARRHFRNWCNALVAAGLDPDVHRLAGRLKGRSGTTGSFVEPERKSQADDGMRLGSPV
jgi:hypothetical protein